ncbi:MAG: hypothetical protein ACJ8F0_09780 [Xanthobacteraceae bacterium]|jgi:hypothetical protein
MLVSAAILMNVRFSALVLMVDVSGSKAVIIIGETFHDAGGVPDGKCGGGSQDAKQVEQGDCARHTRSRRSGQADEHRL